VAVYKREESEDEGKRWKYGGGGRQEAGGWVEREVTRLIDRRHAIPTGRS
jgi:hypothetical protein